MRPGSHSYSMLEQPSYDSYLKASRRSFLLFLVFDVTFTGLLWLIYCTTKGYSLKEAYVNEIQEYDFEISLYDVFMVALGRFVVLSLFYVILKVNHWFPITLITFVSSSFLIAKVVIFAMKGTHRIVTDYIILIVSFIIVWVQTWYLEVKIFTVIKDQISSQIAQTHRINESENLVQIVNERRAYGSLRNNSKGILSEIASFYSPMDSPDNSDNEENSSYSHAGKGLPLNFADMMKQKEYEIVANQLLNEVLNILSVNTGWKLTKESLPESDKVPKITVYAKSFNKIGKVFKVETILPFSDKLVLRVIRDDLEDYTKWNLTIKSTKVLKVFNESLRVLYICVKDQAGGLVTSRDFVNLSKYCFHQNKHILAACHCPNYEYVPAETIIRAENGPSGYIITPISENKSQVTCLINVNLKGWLPQYLIDQTLSTVQIDFITELTKYLHTAKDAN